MKRFGLIGRNISHSFSKNYFTEKFKSEKREDSLYETFDLEEISEVEEIFKIDGLKGFNVTIPYKEQILPYLDELSPEAEKIGAVNCVKMQNEKRIGYNTDAYGFENSLEILLENHHKKALVLGDGGAAKAVKFVLEKLNISYKTVTRNGELNYSDLTRKHIENHLIIVNCTPLGTYPDVEAKPDIPYPFLTSEHLLYDLIYNPEKTLFLQLGEQNGAKTKNGLEMLVLQAEKSWEIWNRLL